MREWRPISRPTAGSGAKYDGAVAEVSNKVNDTYLKANGQEDGVESYDRMVDLIVGYWMK